MDLEGVRKALHRRPFRPFAICLADGRRFFVTRPDSVAVGKRWAFVIGPDDSCALIELPMILSLDLDERHPPQTDQTIIERVRQLYNAAPFNPFIIHLADGRRIPVNHREFMALSPSGRLAAVYQADDTSDIIDLLGVTGLEMRDGNTPGTRRS